MLALSSVPGGLRKTMLVRKSSGRVQSERLKPM
jgi:hypothetical protein